MLRLMVIKMIDEKAWLLLNKYDDCYEGDGDSDAVDKDDEL